MNNNYNMMMNFNNFMNMMNQNQNNNMMNMNNMNMNNMNNMNMNNMNNMNMNNMNMNNMNMNNMDMNQMMMNFNNYMNNNMNNNIMNNNMGIINPQNQQNNENVVNLIFKTKMSKYTIKTNYNETLGSVISKYLDMTRDNNINLYIHNGKKLNESLTVGEAGLLDGAYIYVVPTDDLKGAY